MNFRRGLIIAILVLLGVSDIAHAETYTPKFVETGGKVQLHEIGGPPSFTDSVVQEWTAGEWQAQRHLMEGTRECLDDAYADCQKALLERKTGMKDPITPGEAESAEGLVEDARAEADELPGAITRELDIPSEAGGALDLGAASTVLGAVLLGPAAFKIGVDIGNGLDQLFGFPELKLEEGHPESHAEGCIVEYENAHIVDDRSSGGERFEFPEGYYANCSPPGYGATQREFQSQGIVRAEYRNDIEGTAGQVEGMNHYERLKTTDEGGEYSAFYKEEEIYREYKTYEWYEPEPKLEKCEPGKELPNWLEGADEGPGEGQHECVPVGIPQKLPMSESQLKENKEHGGVEVPTVSPATLPAPGKAELLPEKEMKRALEILPAHTWVTTHTKTTIKKMREEEEAAEIEIPQPEPSEVGTHYETRLKELGFTDVTTEILPETAIDVELGPSEVTKVVPSPRTFVKPETEVVVEVNPDDAPTPGESSKPIGSPTLPGIKFPSFPVLCKGFPFGVPCWLIQTIEGWGASGTCPQWGFENLEIEGTHITNKFDLCKLEPIMEKVRPAILIFATIGLVLLFFRFAKGGSPDSGSQGDDSTGNTPDEVGEH
jgi:hypothetical protein